jgi:hypothetical protein
MCSRASGSFATSLGRAPRSIIPGSLITPHSRVTRATSWPKPAAVVAGRRTAASGKPRCTCGFRRVAAYGATTSLRCVAAKDRSPPIADPGCMNRGAHAQGPCLATAARFRSPPCRRCGCRTGSRRAARASRAPAYRLRTDPPSPPGRARPDAGISCTRRSAAHRLGGDAERHRRAGFGFHRRRFALGGA